MAVLMALVLAACGDTVATTTRAGVGARGSGSATTTTVPPTTEPLTTTPPTTGAATTTEVPETSTPPTTVANTTTTATAATTTYTTTTVPVLDPPFDTWTVILASLPADEYTRTEALAQLSDLDPPGGGVLASADYPSLNAGYWVVYSGVFDQEGDARRRCAELGGGCYHRYLGDEDEAPQAAPDTGGESSIPTVFESWPGGGDIIACDFDALDWAYADGLVTGEQLRAGYVGLLGYAGTTGFEFGGLVDICVVTPPPAAGYTLVVDAPGGVRASHPLRVLPANSDARVPGPRDLLVDGTPVDVLQSIACIRTGDCFDVLVSPGFQLHPSLPAGRYRLTLVAGDQQRPTEFSLRHPTRPWLQVQPDQPYAHRVGGTVRVLLSGFPPNAQVPLGFYRQTGRLSAEGLATYELWETLGTFSVNRDGWAEVEVTVPRVAPGQHCIAAAGFPASWDCSANYGSGEVRVG